MTSPTNSNASRLPRSYRSVGSCYIFQQSPGAERIGGLTVTIFPAADGKGQISAENSLYNSDQTRDDIREYQQEALRGIALFSAENKLPLHNYHVRLSAFLIHDIDSRLSSFATMAQIAFKSALSAAEQKLL